MITDSFQWEDTHLPTLLAQVTVSDDQLRPLAGKSEASSLMGFVAAITTPLSDSVFGLLCQRRQNESQLTKHRKLNVTAFLFVETVLSYVLIQNNWA